MCFFSLSLPIPPPSCSVLFSLSKINVIGGECVRHISAHVWYALIVIYKWFDYKYRLFSPEKKKKKKEIISVVLFSHFNYLSDWAFFSLLLWFHKVIAASQVFLSYVSLILKMFTTCFDRFLISVLSRSLHLIWIYLIFVCMFLIRV